MGKTDTTLQPDIEYLEDVLMLESKQLNTNVKQQYLDDYSNELQAQNKQNRMTTKSAQMRTREMKKQTFAAIHHTINKISQIEGYQVHQIDGIKIMGPMKWIVIILGPNHQAKDLKNLTQDYPDLNIIVILVSNPQGKQVIRANNQITQSKVDQDPVQADLNKLCRSTPEGYMVVIEQRQFEGRESVNNLNIADINKSQFGNRSLMSGDHTHLSLVQSNQLKNILSKDVEQIFRRVCQSIELYKTENIPIITEFLEF